jgi:hypothetical protein
MQFIYLLSNPNGTMKLYVFIVIFGVLMLSLAQIPSFHSLRHINLVSLTLALAYSACVTAGSIYIGNIHEKHVFVLLCIYIYTYTSLTGHSKNAPTRDYSVNGSGEIRVFGAANAVAIIATTYACGIVPEIQVYIIYFVSQYYTFISC